MALQQVEKRNFKSLAPKWEVHPNGNKLSEDKMENLISIYFSKIPDRITAVEIHDLFGCAGGIVEVVISPRRNKFSKRFGFARFAGNGDGRILAVKLDNIMVDGRKIHTNLPRFSRNNSPKGDLRRERNKNSGGMGDRGGSVPKSVPGGSFYKGLSFNKKESGSSFVDIVKGVNPTCHLSFTSSDDNIARLK